MKKILLFILPALLIMSSCGSGGTQQKSADAMKNDYQVRLVTVDPGHFHAALVQKTMYNQVSPEVFVYAPEGPDVQQHLDRINSYNSRTENPTTWKEVLYKGDDFFEKMLAEKTGNVIVLSGNNRKKAEYISRSINGGLNVLADKPMIILPGDFPLLEQAFRSAEEKGILLYDIMTERYEITTILQKLLSQNEEVFGTLLTGNSKDPAVTKVSVHHFSKIVSGAPLIRPAWFFDVDQQGEGIVDVTTHLVHLIQWECFPEQILATSDVEMIEARRWPTIMTKEEFRGVTGFDEFPSYLQKDIKEGKLHVYANGEMTYRLKGIYARVSVEWNYQAPPGTGDTHYSVMRGSRCDLTIKQGAEEKYVPTLYAENVKGIGMDLFTEKLKSALSTLPYEDLALEVVNPQTIKITIPARYRVGHEEHFAQVTERFLEYLDAGKLPDWEVPGMITKYFTTTTALRMAKE
ncbi:MAG TPA: putative oxidoreductase C-terminal domain-containing protein [Bacteroidales bacterium]|nr:putative oxidoreductase C-terminal domain-containing protein [Bacteroidales bacterium]